MTNISVFPKAKNKSKVLKKYYANNHAIYDMSLSTLFVNLPLYLKKYDNVCDCLVVGSFYIIEMENGSFYLWNINRLSPVDRRKNINTIYPNLEELSLQQLCDNKILTNIGSYHSDLEDAIKNAIILYTNNDNTTNTVEIPPIIDMTRKSSIFRKYLSKLNFC